MAELNPIKQVDEKHVLAEVKLMIWSPKMDLVAVASVAGEVVLHRLSWQKVWTLPAVSEQIKIQAMAWRPDGKVLAVGYDSGRVQLCDVENCAILHSFQVREPVSFMSWTAGKKSDDVPVADGEEVPDNPAASSGGEKVDFYEDLSEMYLPKLPAFSKSYAPLSKDNAEESIEDAKKLKGQTELNILMVGTSAGQLDMFAYGILPIGGFDAGETICRFNYKYQIVSAELSDNLGCLCVVIEEFKTNVDRASSGLRRHIYLYRSKLFLERPRELEMLALKFGTILTLVGYLQTTVSQMSEAFEDILLDMDRELTNLAEHKQKVGGGSVSLDFLRLLMFGTPSNELKELLQFHLTDKKLKKLGGSIETSYTNIQKLLLRHLQSVGQAIVYHLTDICALADVTAGQQPSIGLDKTLASAAASIAGSFMLKSVELQQVIDSSLKNFKAFFRWLYIESQRLANDDATPLTGVIKMSQQDIKFVAQFLRENFTNNFLPHRSGFRLEKVGQYLKNADLNTSSATAPGSVGSDSSDDSEESVPVNPWTQLIAESPQLRDSPLLYKPYPEKSLVQVYKMLSAAIDALTAACSQNSTALLELVSNVVLTSGPPPHPPSPVFPSVNAAAPSSRDLPASLYALANTIQQRHGMRGTTQDVPDNERIIYSTFTGCKRDPTKFFISRTHTDTGRTDIACLQCDALDVPPPSLGSNDEGEVSADSRHDTSVAGRHYIVLDVAFYDDRIVSLLLQETFGNGRPVLVQLPLAILYGSGLFSNAIDLGASASNEMDLDEMSCTDVGPMLSPANYRVLENMKASLFAVSGTRKCACVLFSSRRRIRLFLFDVEDEESTVHAPSTGDIHQDDVRRLELALLRD